MSSLKSKRSRVWLYGVAAAVVVVAAGAGFLLKDRFGASQTASTAPKMAGVPMTMRKLTQEQYRHIIADVFGPGIKLAGRMDPDNRKDGLLEIGATEATFSPGSLEQYDLMGRTIAAQILDDKNRKVFMPCTPASPKEPDAACTKQVISSVGYLLYRRPLSPQEIDRRVALAGQAAQKLGSFYKGLESGLSSLLVSPSFLFVKDVAEKDPDHSGAMRLDAYSKASRLSFFMWNSSPDDALLKAAETGEINTPKGLQKQVDRLLASSRVQDGVRGFFADFMQFSLFDALAKDSVIYPKFSQAVAQDAAEQTLRTITTHLVAEDGDYRDLFTTRKTFLTRSLGMIYKVPVPTETDNEWISYEFPADDPHQGLLTQLSFTEMYALPGRSSPTLRGKALREVFLCQTVPTPPNNVDFSKFENTGDKVNKTARERLTVHRSNPTCAGCHAFIDPMGLALENFDGVGAYRTTENDAPIDAGGELDGVKFTDAVGLGKAMHDNVQVTNCAVDKIFAYGAGFTPGKNEHDLVVSLRKSFVDDGYKIRPLLRQIATNDLFYRVMPTPAAASEQAKAASAN